MQGYSYRGVSDVPAREGRLFFNGKDTGVGVALRLATRLVEPGGDKPSYIEQTLLVRRGNVASLSPLHGFYERTGATFPENPGGIVGPDFVNGIMFDGERYVYSRYDEASQDIVFHLVPRVGEFAGTGVHVEEADLQRLEAEGGVVPQDKHTANNWPNGGDGSPRGVTKADNGTKSHEDPAPQVNAFQRGLNDAANPKDAAVAAYAAEVAKQPGGSPEPLPVAA